VILLNTDVTSVTQKSTFKSLITSIETGKYLKRITQKEHVCTTIHSARIQRSQVNEVYNKIHQIMYSKVNAYSTY